MHNSLKTKSPSTNVSEATIHKVVSGMGHLKRTVILLEFEGEGPKALSTISVVKARGQTPHNSANKRTAAKTKYKNKHTKVEANQAKWNTTALRDYKRSELAMSNRKAINGKNLILLP